jgi:hypothetical protein
MAARFFLATAAPEALLQRTAGVFCCAATEGVVCDRPTPAFLEGDEEMTMAAEKEFAHIGETCGCTDHDRDLVHELSKRLDSLWRCDQYIANANDRPQLVDFWQDIKQQEQVNVRRLKQLIAEEIHDNCF